MASAEKKKNRYAFICESTTVITPSEIKILEEGKTSTGQSYFRFNTRLQEADVRNQNKRIYSGQVCESIVNQLSPKAAGGSLLMEVDHPIGTSADPNAAKQRAVIVEYKNCGAMIKSMKFAGGQVLGEIRTLSGFRGPDVAALIQDGVNIGFSLRAMGAVEALQDGTLNVKSPIMPITYDIVSNPSHTNARIMEFLPEADMSLLESAQSIICEGQEFEFFKDDQVTICEGNCCVRKFVDDIIAEQFMSVISKNIRFNLSH